MRGLVISFSTILITFFLIVFAFTQAAIFRESGASILESFFVEKVGFAADDIDWDVKAITGTEVTANRTSGVAGISINDSLPGDTNKFVLLDYWNFAETVYAGQQNAEIGLGLGGMADGKTELLFSNGVRYEYFYAGDSNADFFSPGNDTGVLTYDINITVNGSSIEAIPWTWQDVSGDINVNLNFVDTNASNEVHHSGKLDSSLENVYRWEYGSSQGDFFEARIGSVSGNGKALRLAESFDAQGTRALVDMRADFPEIREGLEWHYDADLNYSREGVSLRRKVLEGRA